MIHIVGNVGVDLSMGPIPALPAWGTELLAGTSVYRPGGAAVNVALGLAGLYQPDGITLDEIQGKSPQAGAGRQARRPVPVRVYCAVGDDRDGWELRAQLERAGVDATCVEPLPGETTSLGLALVREDGERAFVTDLGALRKVDIDWVRTRLADVTGPAWVLATGMSLFPGLGPAGVAALFRWLRSRGLRTALDTGWDVEGWTAERVAGWLEALTWTDLFLPNEMEAQALTGMADPAAAAAVLQRRSGGIVVVKTGPAGCWVVTPDGVRHYPIRPVPVPDTTGAGDLFSAGVLYGLDHGWMLSRAVELGQRLAAVVLQNRRSRFPSVAELLGDDAVGEAASQRT